MKSATWRQLRPDVVLESGDGDSFCVKNFDTGRHAGNLKVHGPGLMVWHRAV